MVLVLLAKQCFTGWMYWGKVWSRGKTDYRLAWNVSEYIPCQTTNIMEGEPLGGRWWVLRIKKGGGKAGQIPRLCV